MTRLRLAVLAVPALLAAGCSNAASNDDAKPAPPAAAASSSPGGGKSLTAAVKRLPVAAERRVGYKRDAFHLWIDADHDQCDTRKEILISEAVKKPEQGDNCALTGGEWRSYYDEKTVTVARSLDIDHVVPLAEAWDSGASKWTADQREQYANDLKDPRALVAVTLSTNRSKGDRDPAEWMPPSKAAYCQYVSDWVSTKLTWKLSVDQAELDKLTELAADCPSTSIPK